MNKIIAKKSISADLVKFEIRTSVALKEIKVGQHVVLIVEKNQPEIPLAVLRTDSEKETITVIVYAKDQYTKRLAELNSGSEIFRIEGPFGYPARIENFGSVLCVGRGPGIVMLLPILNSLRAAGNQICTILSAQTKEGIILENEIKAISNEVITITDDGSIGLKSSVCQAMIQSIKTINPDQVFAIGSATIIKVTCAHTTKYNIPNQAILYLKQNCKNAGHGIFKVSICGSAKAVCVDGFNFNAWYPNFEEMIKRFGHEELESPRKVNSTAEVNMPV